MRRQFEVWGHSDDLLYAECDSVNFSEEMRYPCQQEPNPVEYFVCGVLFTAEYDGEWTFDVWNTWDTVNVTKFEVGCGPSEQKNNYTQLLKLEVEEEEDFTAYRV